jgi:lon-related putative ATP-dependent protease
MKGNGASRHRAQGKRAKSRRSAGAVAPAFRERLPAAALRRRCDASALGFSTTEEVEDADTAFGQTRALDALRLAIAMEQPGYNVFALGPSGVGKHATVRDLLARHAALRSSPSDWVYVEDFARPAEPRAIPLPTGTARRFAADVHDLVLDLRVSIPAAFEGRDYATRLEEIQAEFQAKQEALFSDIEKTGEGRGVGVVRSPNAVVFAPVRDGRVVPPDEFEKFPADEKERFRQTARELSVELSDRMKELPRLGREFRERVRDLDRAVTRRVVDTAIEELVRRYREQPRVVEYFESVRTDVVEHAADFRRDKDESGDRPFVRSADQRFGRYAVNVLVENQEGTGAPVVYEDRATYDHLVGRIEHYAEFGNLVTNLSLIKSGSLHRANGGYLLLDAQKVLTEPYAWSALKRALFSRRIEVEALAHWIGLSTSESLRPESIPLDVKVVLFGSRDLYYLLCEHDAEFAELFKVEADFEDAVDRTPETERGFSRMVSTLARKRNLSALSASAVACLVEQASRVAGDGRKLSTNVRVLFDLAAEAEHFAKGRGHGTIEAEDVKRAIDARTEQRDGLRDRLLEAVTRKSILIDVSGRKVGQVNGLAAITLGEFTFGRPTRITATAHIGDGRIVDIEREVELGGPLHSKGVLILANYLAERYAKRYPLSLSASLVFEQSYWGVERDSASLAELCALLSALAEVPVKQSIALTGSVNQWGQVQAIGAVNDKIEGFYDTCRALGAEQDQGVIVPRANVEHLMLREDVAEAAARGEFHVYAVDTVDEAMEILTDLTAGRPGENGESPEGTLNAAIEHALIEFAVVAKRFGEFVRIDSGNGKARRKRTERRAARTR